MIRGQKTTRVRFVRRKGRLLEIKRVYIHKSDDSAGVQARLKRLETFIASGQVPDGVSMRAYTSQEDDTVVVETWMFESSETETAATAVLADILAEVRPGDRPASHGTDLGPLGDRDRLYWND